MSGYLIDTNVVSELTKASPDSGVIAFPIRTGRPVAVVGRAA